MSPLSFLPLNHGSQFFSIIVCLFAGKHFSSKIPEFLMLASWVSGTAVCRFRNKPRQAFFPSQSSRRKSGFMLVVETIVVVEMQRYQAV